jgi:hypothetical protein
MFGRPPADHLPHDRIDSEPFGIVRIFIASEPAVYRLASQGHHRMLGVLAGAPVV